MATQLRNLQELWAPCLCIGRITGMYWYSEQKPRARLWRAYTLCWLVLCSGFVGWWIFDFFTLRQKPGSCRIVVTIMESSAVLFHIHKLITILVMFSASGGSSGFSKFYELWNELKFFDAEVDRVETNVRKLTFVSIIFALLSFTVEVTVGLVEHIIRGYLFFRVYANVMAYCIEVFAVFFVFLICSTLAKLFEVLNRRASTDLRCQQTLQDVQNFHRNYFVIVEMVEVADGMFHLYIGSFVMLCLLQLTFKTYVALRHYDTVVNSIMFFFVFWPGRQLLFLCIMLKSCINVNSQAHGSFTTFHKFLLKGQTLTNQKKILSMQSFLGRDAVSFSIFKMHPITRGLVISIASIYLTYVLILIQFI